jgi:nucleolar pre-ribosomal-associated protein 1
LEAILAALKTCTIANPDILGPRLSQLLVLRSLLQHSSALEDMIAEAVSTCLPVAHHGRSLDDPALDLSSLEISATLAEMRWNHHLDCLPEELDIRTFLVQQSWRRSTVRIVSDLLYKQSSSREAYLRWLGAGHRTSVDSQKLATTLHAYLDAALQQADAMGDSECEILASQFWHLLSSNQTDSSRAMLPTCATLLFSIIKRSSSKPQDHLCVLLRHIQSIPNGQLDPGHLVLGRRLHELFHHEAEDIITCMVDHSLQQVVRVFSNDTEELENTLKFTDELGASVIC